MSLARPANIVVMKDGNDVQSSAGSMRDAAVRQAFLDALPIPAALFERAKEPLFSAANAAFQGLVEDMGISDCLFAEPRLRQKFDCFCGSVESMHRFEWIQGEGIGSRHYHVSLSYMGDLKDDLVLVTLIDRTSAVEAERSLRAEMLRDSLTGLPNRTAFIEAVDSAIESQDHQSFAILIVDLTRFSRVNESMGSLAGDELIITVARRLVSALRVGDVLARLAGDEFGILLKLNDGAEDALQAARRIHAALLTP